MNVNRRYPDVYYELASIPGVIVDTTSGTVYESVLFIFKELGRKYRLYLHIRHNNDSYRLSWKVSDDYQGRVITITSLEEILNQVDEEGQSFLLFHLNIFQDQTNKGF